MPKAPTVIALARDLLLFRARPQDLPFSPALLFTLIALCIGFDVLLLLARENASVLSAVLASHALRVLLFAMFFAWRGILPRLIKSLTALWLSDLAFRVLLLPLVLIMAGASDGVAPAAPSALVELAVLAVLAMGIWQLMVQGHILRHALEVSLALGALAALLIGLIPGIVFLVPLAAHSGPS